MVTSSFQFSNPVLLKLDFQVNENYSASDNHLLPIQLQVKNPQTNSSESTATVELSVKVGEENDQMPYYIHAIMSANFKWDPKKYDDDNLKNLLQKNAPALLLSYVRPIIANISNASPYAVTNLPFFDFTQEPIQKS